MLKRLSHAFQDSPSQLLLHTPRNPSPSNSGPSHKRACNSCPHLSCILCSIVKSWLQISPLEALTTVVGAAVLIVPALLADASTSRPAATKVVTEAPQMHLPSILPPQVAQQIRNAQQKAALSGWTNATEILTDSHSVLHLKDNAMSFYAFDTPDRL